MKSLIVLAICLFSLKKAVSQEAKGFVNTSQTAENIENGNTLRTFDERYEGIEGHPYMFNENQEIWLVTIKPDTILIFGNLNLEAKELISVSPDRVKGIIPLRNISYFLVDGVSWNEIQINDKKHVVSIVYASKAFKVLRSHDKVLERADYAGAYSSGETKDEFKYKTSLWLEMDNKLTPFKMRASNLSEIFNLPAKQIRSLIKKSYLDLNRAENYFEILKLLDENS
ncbi:hypothetical protein [Ekhidna sp.]